MYIKFEKFGFFRMTSRIYKRAKSIITSFSGGGGGRGEAGIDLGLAFKNKNVYCFKICLQNPKNLIFSLTKVIRCKKQNI